MQKTLFLVLLTLLPLFCFAQEENSLTPVRMHPDKYIRSESVDNFIYFENLPPYVQITFYTIEGEELATYCKDDEYTDFQVDVADFEDVLGVLLIHVYDLETNVEKKFKFSIVP